MSAFRRNNPVRYYYYQIIIATLWNVPVEFSPLDFFYQSSRSGKPLPVCQTPAGGRGLAVKWGIEESVRHRGHRPLATSVMITRNWGGGRLLAFVFWLRGRIETTRSFPTSLCLCARATTCLGWGERFLYFAEYLRCSSRSDGRKKKEREFPSRRILYSSVVDRKLH